MSRRKTSSKHRSLVSGMPPRPRPVVRRARRTRIVIVLGAILMLIGGTLYWHEARRHDAGAPQEPTTADQPTVLIDHSEPASLMRAFPPSVLPGPDSDGWQSEALAARISQQLDRLARLLVDPESIQIDELVELAEPGFTCGPLRPESRREIYRDADVVVSRAIDSLRGDASDVHRGIDGLAVALTSLVGPWSKSTGIQAKFKLIRLEAIGEQMVTAVYYQASGHAPDALLQQNATWKVRWNVARTGSPRLASIVVSQFEEVTTRMSRGLFVDETLLRFARMPLLRDQLAHGIDFYQAHIPRRLNVFRFGHHGLALGDVNGDELDDIYLCQPGGLPNRLLIHERDGTLRDISATAGVDALDFSRSARTG